MTQPFLPNEADAFNDNQAEPDSVDFEILLLGQQRTGVISGCAVTESSPAAQTVDVALGEVVETGEQISVSLQEDQAVSAADGTNPRIDLITINSSGTVVVTAGTPAAQPVMPAVPATSIPLATLYIAASDNTHADNQINDKRMFVADRWQVNAKDVGCVGDGSTDDTTAMQAAFDLAISQSLPLYIPEGDYLVDPGLTWDDDWVRIHGDGSKQTVFKFSAVTTDGIIFGQDAFVDDLGQQGWIRNLGAKGPSDIPPVTPDFKTAFTFNNLRFTNISDLYVRNFDIGYSLINNNYGISFWNVHARYSKCNVGLLLETGTETGNDIPFVNCWLSGKKAAINMAGIGSGGYTFIGGQLAAGADLAADDDDAALLRLGKTYETGTETGEAGRIHFYGTLFEPAEQCWMVRAYRPTPGLFFSKVTFSATETGADAAIGLMKSSVPFHDQITWDNCLISGTYQDSLLDFPALDSGADPTYIEIGTIGRPVVNTVTLDLHKRGMLDREGLARSVVLQGGDTHSEIILDDLRMRGNSGLMEVSTDASVWKPLHVHAIETATAITLDWRDGVVNMDSAGGTRVVTLPDNADFDGKSYLIRRDGSNTVTIDRAGSDTFDDADIQKTLDSDSAAIGIFSIGDGEWKIVATEGTVGGS